MTRKALLRFVPLVLALVLTTGAAFAGNPAPSVPQTPQPAVAADLLCEMQAPALAKAEAVQAPTPLDLFTPESQQAAICPLIGCVNDQYCRRDRDCTTAPGGTCNLFCPTRGCCAYPSQ